MCVQEPTATVSYTSNLLLGKCWTHSIVSLRVLITIQVTNVRQQEKLKYPPHPLNTIELEKRASRYFRMSSEQTMKVSKILGIQKLLQVCFVLIIEDSLELEATSHMIYFLSRVNFEEM